MVGSQDISFSPLVQEPLGAPEHRWAGRGRVAAWALLGAGCLAALVRSPQLPAFVARTAVRSPALRGRVDRAISASLMGFGSAPTCQRPDEDVDYEYSDLAGLGRIDSIVSSQDCCALCQGEPSCKAYSWVKDAGLVTGNPGQCWLKGGMYRNSNPKKGVFSAFVRDPFVVESVLKELREAKEAEEKVAKAAEAFRATEATVRLTSTTLSSTASSTLVAPLPPAPSTPIPIGAAVPGVEMFDPVPAYEEMSSSSSSATAEPTSTATSTSTFVATSTVTRTSTTSVKACCSFEPLFGCSSSLLNISEYCDVSKGRCEDNCGGKWLEGGADELTEGLDLRSGRWIGMDPSANPDSLELYKK